MPMESSNSLDFKVKIIIKSGSLELLAEDTISNIKDNLDSMTELIELLKDKFPIETETLEDLPTDEEIAKVSSTDIPVIEATRSTMESIRRLFLTSWGKKPRNVAETLKALEINAIYDSSSSVSTSLIRLVRKGELRRIRKAGIWAYYRLPQE